MIIRAVSSEGQLDADDLSNGQVNPTSYQENRIALEIVLIIEFHHCMGTQLVQQQSDHNLFWFGAFSQDDSVDNFSTDW